MLQQESSKLQAVRIPFIGTYNSRDITNEDSDGASGIIGVGIIGQMVIGANTTQQKDQRFHNLIPQKILGIPGITPDRSYLTKRAGFQSHSTPEAASPGTAITIWTGSGTGEDIITT